MVAQAQRAMLETALAYLDDEWSVFPVCVPVIGRPGHCLQHGLCKHPGKTPLLKWGTYQDRLPSRAEVQSWWGRKDWQNANIGLATGELSDVVVIDLDGEVARAEASRRGYEPGPWVRTGRVGGQHLYFRYRADAPTIFSKVGGIDFRGQGGFVLLPPSLHYSGTHYIWGERVERGDPLPILPKWIDELASTGEDGQPRGKVDFGKLLHGVGEGQRDQELFRAAAKLRGIDLPYDVALEVIQKIAGQCQPAFDADEARAKVDSAYGRYQPNISSAGDGPRILTGPQLAAMAFDAQRWAIPELLPAGLTILAGRPKLGKSWLALGWALDIARPSLALKKLRVVQGETLYLALEDGPRRMQERMALMLGDAPPPAGFNVVTEWPRTNEGGLDLLEQWLIAHPDARMVVVDTFKRIRPVEKSTQRLYDLDYDAIAPVAEVARRFNVAIVLVFHTRKMQSDDPLEMVSGTLGISGAADAVIVLRRERGQADASLFVTGRDVEEQDLALRWEKEDMLAWTLLGNAEDFRRSTERQAILETIRTIPGSLPRDVADALGKSPGSIRYLLFQMVRDLEVRVREGRYYAIANDPNGSLARAREPNANSANALSQMDPSTPNAHPNANGTAVSAVGAVRGVSGVSGVSGKVVCRRCGRGQESHGSWDLTQCEWQARLPYKED